MVDIRDLYVIDERMIIVPRMRVSSLSFVSKCTATPGADKSVKWTGKRAINSAVNISWFVATSSVSNVQVTCLDDERPTCSNEPDTRRVTWHQHVIELIPFENGSWRRRVPLTFLEYIDTYNS